MSFSLESFTETLASAWVKSEENKIFREISRNDVRVAELNAMNSTDDYKRTSTGENYDGSTLTQPTQLVNGVSNGVLLMGAGAVMVVALLLVVSGD